MAPAGTMIAQFSDEDRAAIASAEDVIKRQDAKIAGTQEAIEVLVKRIASVEEIRNTELANVARRDGELRARLRKVEAALPEAALDLSEGVGEQAAHIRALGDRMTALEKMLTGYVSDLNSLADRHSAYMLETRLMVERLDKISGAWDKVLGTDLADLAERVARVEQAGEIHERRLNDSEDRAWAKVAPEIYEGLPRDITAPIGAIIQGLNERVDGLGVRLDGLNLALDSVTSGGGNIGRRITELEERLDKVVIGSGGMDRILSEQFGATRDTVEFLRRENEAQYRMIQRLNEAVLGNFMTNRPGLADDLADLRASVKVLGEDITAVGDRLGDHLGRGEDGEPNRELREKLLSAPYDEMLVASVAGWALDRQATPEDFTAACDRDPGDEQRRDDETMFDHGYFADRFKVTMAQFAEDMAMRVEAVVKHADLGDGTTANALLHREQFGRYYQPTRGFDHGYLATAVEAASAELAANLVKRIKGIARAADLDEAPF